MLTIVSKALSLLVSVKIDTSHMFELLLNHIESISALIKAVSVWAVTPDKPFNARRNSVSLSKPVSDVTIKISLESVNRDCGPDFISINLSCTSGVDGF